MGYAHRAAFLANAAARGMPDPAKFAALSAGQGAAVAHVAAHDLGAAATGAWTVRQAGNLPMDLGERTGRVSFLIADRDSKVTEAFGEVFAPNGMRVITTPVRSPWANSVDERFVGSYAASAWIMC